MEVLHQYWREDRGYHARGDGAVEDDVVDLDDLVFEAQAQAMAMALFAYNGHDGAVVDQKL